MQRTILVLLFLHSCLEVSAFDLEPMVSVGENVHEIDSVGLDKLMVGHPSEKGSQGVLVLSERFDELTHRNLRIVIDVLDEL